MYRLLDVNETMLSGDEWFDTNRGWCKVGFESVGISLTQSALPVRRKIEDAKELGTTPNTGSPKLADDVDNAVRLIKAEYYDEGFELLSKVVSQLRAGA